MKARKSIAIILSALLMLCVTSVSALAAPPVSGETYYDAYFHFGIEAIDAEIGNGTYSDGLQKYVQFTDSDSLPDRIVVKQRDADKPTLNTLIDLTNVYDRLFEHEAYDALYFTKTNSTSETGEKLFFFMVNSRAAWNDVDVYAVFDVTYTGEHYSFKGEGIAYNDIDYITTITADEGYTIKSSGIKIGGVPYTEYSVAPGASETSFTLTIPGADIVGDIEINIVAEKIEETPEEPEEKFSICDCFDRFFSKLVEFFISLFSFEIVC